MLSALEKVSGRTLEQMSVPSPDEVNERRASRLTESITSSLGSPQFHAFRALVEGYAAEQGVEMVDIAAALAVLSADDPNFFLRPEGEVRQPARSERRDRDDRGPREPRERGARSSQDRASQDSGDWTRYRLAVGKRHKIGPSAIVGALANEGGLKRSDFGKITIGADHAIVELTADLPAAVFDALATTRISGKLIDLRLDDGPPPRRERARVGDVDRGGRGGRPGKGPRKPRHTSRRD